MPWLTPNSVPAVYSCRPLFIPNDRDLIAAVRGALLDLVYLDNWEAFGEADPPEVVDAMRAMLENFDHEVCPEGGGMPIGAIFEFATADPPAGSVRCDGTVYHMDDYPDFWAVIDPVWKTDSTHWAAPDRRNRFSVGAGDEYDPGDTGGEAAHQLTVSEMPSHDGHSHYTVNTPTGAAASYAQNTPQGSSYGGDEAHENRPPYLALPLALQVE